MLETSWQRWMLALSDASTIELRRWLLLALGTTRKRPPPAECVMPAVFLGSLTSCFGMSMATPGDVLSKLAAAATDLQNLDKSGLDGSWPSKTKF